MKSLITNCLLFLILFLTAYTVDAQKLYSIDRLIINGRQDTKCFVTRYDLQTYVYDTAFAFYAVLNGFSALDHYNGRYFSPNGTFDTSNSFMRKGGIFLIDLTEDTINYLPCKIPTQVLEFDMFSNKLIFPYQYINTNLHLNIRDNYLLGFDLGTALIDTIFKCSADTVAWGVFNPFDNTVVYIVTDSATKHSIVTLDIEKGGIVNKVPVDYSVLTPFFDYATRQYFAMSNNGVVLVDPRTGNITAKAPFIAREFLNAQNHSFDSYRGYYIAPYRMGSELIIEDVNNGSVIKKDNYFPNADYQQVYDTAEIPLIRINHQTELQVVYGRSYQWYMNNQPIAGATGQKYSPTENGIYKVEVTFLNNRTAFSEEVHFITTGISLVQSTAEITLSPNPASDMVFLTIQKGNFDRIKIFDPAGREVINQSIQPQSRIQQIDVSRLMNGVYSMQVLGKGINHIEKIYIEK